MDDTQEPDNAPRITEPQVAETQVAEPQVADAPIVEVQQDGDAVPESSDAVEALAALDPADAPQAAEDLATALAAELDPDQLPIDGGFPGTP